jgi:asparagine N-glycosylation enzyme membrane subunit Stt3
MTASYPVQFDVDFPTRPLDRVSTAFRIFAALPILVVLGLLSSQTLHSDDRTTFTLAGGAAVLFLPLVLMLLFRQKYPRWWFDWNINLLRFSNRVTAYLALLDDRYPSTDEEQAVHLSFEYPDARQMNRWLPLVKWLLAIPHYVVLFFLAIAAVIAIVLAWFVILFTGRYPRRLFNFVVGVLRWSNRVTGYAFALVTDQYPPFRLS